MTELPWDCETLRGPLPPEGWIWEEADRVLYTFCHEKPSHCHQPTTIAKLWLIGRAYAAAFERGKSSEISTAELYRRAADVLKRFEDDIADLERREDFGRDTLGAVIALHGRIVNALAEAHPDGRRATSLVSKYLHFHLPDVVPIYDSRVRKVLSSLYSSEKTPGDMYDDSSDPEYRVVAWRAFKLREQIFEECGTRLTPKQLDQLLWMGADDKA